MSTKLGVNQPTFVPMWCFPSRVILVCYNYCLILYSIFIRYVISIVMILSEVC
jgi:hypothetical protein